MQSACVTYLGFIIYLFLFSFCSNSFKNYSFCNCIILKSHHTSFVERDKCIPIYKFMHKYIYRFILMAWVVSQTITNYKPQIRRGMIARERALRTSTDVTTDKLHWGHQKTIIKKTSVGTQKAQLPKIMYTGPKNSACLSDTRSSKVLWLLS